MGNQRASYSNPLWKVTSTCLVNRWRWIADVPGKMHWGCCQGVDAAGAGAGEWFARPVSGASEARHEADGMRSPIDIIFVDVSYELETAYP